MRAFSKDNVITVFSLFDWFCDSEWLCEIDNITQKYLLQWNIRTNISLFLCYVYPFFEISFFCNIYCINKIVSHFIIISILWSIVNNVTLNSKRHWITICSLFLITGQKFCFVFKCQNYLSFIKKFVIQFF